MEEHIEWEINVTPYLTIRFYFIQIQDYIPGIIFD